LKKAQQLSKTNEHLVRLQQELTARFP